MALAPVLLLGCAPADPPIDPPAPPVAPSQAPDAAQNTPAPEVLVPVTPPAALTPLPTIAQVQDSVSRGRVDPFAPVEGPQAGAGAAAGSGERGVGAGGAISLQGVMAVGSQVQALVRTSAGSGAICVGPAGRCSVNDGELLPKAWTVRSIDLQRGCFTYSVEGKAQKPVCIDDESAEEAKV